MKKFTTIIAVTAITGLLSACNSLPDYERLDQPYDRQAICKRIDSILDEHQKNHNLSNASFKRVYDDYKIYGCDK